MAERIGVGEITGEEVPATPSATVMLLRGGDERLEVLMLERHLDSDFAGGAYAFPGGKVDDTDRSLDAGRWSGPEASELARELSCDAPADALGLHVAAVRETFEEAGVLLATSPDGPVDAALLATETYVEARRRLNVRGEPWDWRPWLAAEGLALDLSALALFSWWATPAGVHRRFDTRFFLAQLPDEQAEVAAHNHVETTGSRWIAPSEALAQAERGAVTIVYPTRKNLAALSAYPTAATAFAAAAARETDRRRVQPRIIRGPEGELLVQHPHGGPPEPG
ncbi:MAG: NUDIX domain-containing protein [Actinobacteria bacterium]|nr:NUDIX domain-containing protein [Actinomycetota bacterium]